MRFLWASWADKAETQARIYRPGHKKMSGGVFTDRETAGPACFAFKPNARPALGSESSAALRWAPQKTRIPVRDCEKVKSAGVAVTAPNLTAGQVPEPS